MIGFKSTDTKSIKLDIIQNSIPKVVIRKKALLKMNALVEHCSDEVGWLGTATFEKNTYYINDVFVFEQEVHSTTTEITPKGLTTFASELLETENGIEIWNNIKVWGHSHVNMSTSPSGQDNSQMETFKQGGHDWFIRIIANKKGSVRLDLYNYAIGVAYLDIPWNNTITHQEAMLEKKIEELKAEYLKKLEVITKALEEQKASEYTVIEEDIKKEIAEKVKKKTYATYTNYNNRNNVNLWDKTGIWKGYDEEEDVFNVYGYQYAIDKKKETIKIEDINEDNISEILDLGLIVDITDCITTAEILELLQDYDYDTLKLTFNDAEKLSVYANKFMQLFMAEDKGAI